MFQFKSKVAGVPVAECMSLKPILDTLKSCPHIECRFVPGVADQSMNHEAADASGDAVMEAEEGVEEQAPENDKQFFMADKDWILHGVRK